MSLIPPEKLQKLQATLRAQAKASPQQRSNCWRGERAEASGGKPRNRFRRWRTGTKFLPLAARESVNLFREPDAQMRESGTARPVR